MLEEEVPIYKRPADLLSVISDTMVKMAQIAPCSSQTKTKFCTKAKTNASFPAYLQRIYKFMGCSTSCFIVAMILLDRIQQKDPIYAISRKNLHKLFITAMLIAVKVTDDVVSGQQHYAKVAGFPVEQLNGLEHLFLSVIESSEFIDFTHRLEDSFDRNAKPKDEDEEMQPRKIHLNFRVPQEQKSEKSETSPQKSSEKSYE